MLTSLLYLLVGTVFGFYYGWLDDIQDLALFSGLFTPNKFTDPDNLILFSNLFKKLYTLWPNFAWYGYTLHSILFISLVLLTYNLVKISIEKNIKPLMTAIYLALFYCIFFIEVIAFFNFTYVTMIAMMSGLFCYFNKTAISIKVVALLLIFMSLLMRLDAALFMAFLFLFTKFIINYKPFKEQKVIAVTAVFVLGVSLVLVIRSNPKGIDQTYIKDVEPYLYSLQDAFSEKNMPESDKDSFILESIINWNFFDRYAINKDFVEKYILKYNSLDNITSFSIEKIGEKLKGIYSYSTAYDKTYNGYNWFVTTLIIIATLFSIMLIQLLGNKNKSHIMRTITAQLFIISILIAIGIFVKLENRIVFPSLLFIGYFTFLCLVEQNSFIKPNQKIIFVVILMLFGCSIFQLQHLKRFSNQKADELSKKRAIVKEINATFNDKTLIFDFHSIYLIHDTPFKQVKLNPSNTYMVAAHYWLLPFKDLQNYYLNLCGSDRIDHIMQYYASKKDSVVFISTAFNIQFLEQYLHGVYNLDLNFKDYSYEKNSLGDIKYSYVLWPHEFKYSIIE